MCLELWRQRKEEEEGGRAPRRMQGCFGYLLHLSQRKEERSQSALHMDPENCSVNELS